MKHTTHEVLKAVHDIATLMGEGYSISYARTKICGGQSKTLCKLVMKNDRYLELLNKYMSDRNIKYVKENGKLKCVRK